MRELSYMLKGLTCAHCASKIQESINKANGVESANLIFATQRLNVTVKDHALDVLQIVRNIVDSIEPGVEVVDMNTSAASGDVDSVDLKKEFAILGIGAVLFIAGLLLNLPFIYELVIFGLSYIITGKDVLSRAFKNILRGQIFDENFLMSVATLGAFALKELPEAVAVMLFFRIGEVFEEIAVNNSRKSIKALIDIRPEYANLITLQGIRQVNPGDVRVGNMILVKPGEKVPLDGIVADGNSSLDTSALTGESAPRDVSKGDSILSGTINTNGVLTVEVTKSFSQSTVSRILDLVQNAASKKAPTENFITKFARYYTPVVVAAALLIALLPPVITGSMAFSGWINRALIFLVISCPCALVISIPLSFFGGLGGASRNGILIKGSNYLEALNSINTVVFDKTGTLTRGVFKVTDVSTHNGYSQEQLLEYAALAECHSNHPIAKSVLEAYGKAIDDAVFSSYQEIPGFGVKVTVGDKTILAGNEKLLYKEGCNLSDVNFIQGTVIHVAVDNCYAGYISISDQLKEDSRKAVSQLRNMVGMRIAMLTGDNENTAKHISEDLNIDEFYSGLLPHQKVEMVEKIKAGDAKSKLAFVGDGINDAPVLALADVGVAMGGLGSDAAIEASDVILMTDEPSKLVDAIRIARKTHRIVWQNIIFALGVKLLVMLLGAFGYANMWEAVFADVGVTVIAVFNSLRAMRQ